MSTPKILTDIRNLKKTQSAQATTIAANTAAAAAAQKTAAEASTKAQGVETAVTKLNGDATVIGSVDYKIKLSENKNLLGKYYLPTANIPETGSPETHNINTIPGAGWVSVGGSQSHYESSGYGVETDVASSNNLNYPIYYAVNNNISTPYVAVLGTTQVNIIITLPSPLRVIKFKYSTDAANTGMIVYGSNNKSTWVEISRITNPVHSQTQMTEFSVTSPGTYQYYKFNFTRALANSLTVYELQIGSYTLPTYELNLVVPDIPNPLAEGQRILIKTPQYNVSGIIKAKFNSVDLDAILLPNRYYELIYMSGKYLSKEVV